MQTLSTTPADVDGLDVEDLIVRPGVYVVEITPDDAKRLLERNTKNRHPKPNAIDRYAKTMANGKWRRTNQGIGISRSGELVDGQNRLMACIQAGVPFETTLATGLDEEAKDVVDVGVKRSLGDSLRMAGYINVVALAGGVGLRMRYEEVVRTGQPWRQARSMSVTHDEALAYTLEHPELAEHTTSSWVVRKAFSIVPVSVIIAFESMAYEYDPFKAEEFRNGLITGANLSEGDPRLVLRNYLMRLMSSTSRRVRGADSMHMLGMFIKAFNDFVNGDKREIIVFKHEEQMPVVGAKRRPRYGKNAKVESVEDEEVLAGSEVVLS